MPGMLLSPDHGLQETAGVYGQGKLGQEHPILRLAKKLPTWHLASNRTYSTARIMSEGSIIATTA